MDHKKLNDDEIYEEPSSHDIGDVVEVTLGNSGSFPDGNAFVNYFTE